MYVRVHTIYKRKLYNIQYTEIHIHRACIVLNSTVLHKAVLSNMMFMVSLLNSEVLSHTPRSLYLHIHNQKTYKKINK